MRIIIDLQGLQSSSSGSRGVGRYTENLVRNILLLNQRERKHEIILALNGALLDSIMDIRHRFHDVIDQKDIVVWQQFYDTTAARNPHDIILKAATVTRESFLNSFNPDLIFSTNLQEGLFDPATTGVKNLPSDSLYCSTLHDVVPFFYPHYLWDPAIRKWYDSKIADAVKSDIILTVSETSRRQIADFLDIDVSRINAIHNGVDPDAFNARPADPGQLRDVRNRYETGDKYYLYYGGCDEHKNLPFIVNSYAQLVKCTKDIPKLIIAGRDAQRNKPLADLVHSLSVEDHVIFPGFVQDEDLPLVIKGAEAFIFPSLHEGFGLPALEAMACGVATIGARDTSVAEIIGDERALFDGKDQDELVALLSRLTRDADFRRDLGSAAAERASTFSWEKSAEQFLQLLEGLPARTRPLSPANPLNALRDELVWEFPVLGENTRKAIAHSIAESLPVQRTARLYVDISTIAIQDDRSGIQRVTRAICHEFLRNPPPGLDVVAVYSKPGDFAFREANSYLSRERGTQCAHNDDRVVDFHNGDTLLFLDLNPGLAISKRDSNRYLRGKGVKVYYVVYDLLPLLRPGAFWPELCNEFREWVNVVAASDGAVCISRAVADELKAYVELYGERRVDPFHIGWFHLGADIDNSAPSKGLPDDASRIIEKAKALRSFLMVGTVEPRKGHRQTLAAFEKLWAQSKDENIGLFIVGRLGWGMHDFSAMLKNHPELGRRLFWLPGISDEYLEKIYDQCLCLIAASDGEGFGLPLIEAAQRSMPMIIRDIPVFREVAGPHAFYFENDPDPDVMVAAIGAWLDHHKAASHPTSTNMPWLKWEDSAAQLRAAITNGNWLYDIECQGVLPANMRVPFNSRHVQWKGFAEPESAFRWTIGARATISFLWNSGDSAHLRMRVDAAGTQDVRITLNGVEHYRQAVTGRDQMLMFSMSGLKQGSNVIDFHLPDARSSSLHDIRELGIAVREFQIVEPVYFSRGENNTLKYNSHSAEWINFSPAEDGFKWSLGHHCQVGFFWEGDASPVRLEVGAVGLGRQHVTLFCNGKECFSGKVEPGRPGAPEALAFQCSVQLKAGFNLITFDLPDASTPGPNDSRILGIALSHLTFG